MLSLTRKERERNLVCQHCGRPIVRNTGPRHRWARALPKLEWLHNAKDFDPSKPIDCFTPEPKED